nr:retrovirus-related Pol polyprotein from transposon TNT 1-94 [Tanacetum cinerariifolium]
MNKLFRHNLVRGLPTKCFENDHTCTACLKGKQHKASCKSKLLNSVSKPLHTLHMDLFGPTSVSSISHKWYCLVVTDDFSRFTWTFFLKTKDETSGILRKFITEIENLKDLKVKIIRLDNGGEFRNKEINDFCLQKGIKREFSNARTPQQNGVAERRNRTMIEAARTMLADAKLPVTFWAEAVNTACYVQNRVLVNKSQNKTPYELFNARTPVIGFLKPLSYHVMILNTLDNLGKFEAKRDEGYFIGYSMSSKAFRVFNKRTRKVEENLHVEFLENKAIEKGAGPNWLFDIDSLTKSKNYVPMDAGTNSTNLSGTKDAARQEVKNDVSSLRYISLPNWVHDALLESSSSKPQDDFSTDLPESSENSNPTATSTNPLADQLETLTVEPPIPTVSSPVLTACFTDSPEPSSDAKLISKRVTNQVETPSLDNILTLANRFEDILGVTTNSDEPNGVEAVLHLHLESIRTILKEEGIDYDEVFAPVARIEVIRLFLAYALFMGFTVYQMDVKSAFLYGTINEEVYVMQPPGFQDLEFPARVYKVEKSIEFEALMHEKFQMSVMGELNFFLGLQVLQKEDGIFLSQDKYVGDILKKFGYSDVRSSNTPIDKENPWGKDGTGKDTIMATSTTKAEYVTVASCCGQVLWIQNLLLDYEIETTEEGSKILATIDGILRTVTESSLRRNLKLQDKEGISSLPDTELFENLTLMGYNISLNQKFTIQKGFNEFSNNIATALICLATNRTYNFLKMIFDGLVKNVNNKVSKLLMYPRARIAQSLALPPVADEPASPLRDVSKGEACLTESSLRADQDRATIAKTSTLPHDSAPRVTSPATAEGSMQQTLNKLMDFCTSLQRQHLELISKFKAQELEINRLKARVKLLEDREVVATERSGDDAPIKGRNLYEGEVAADRVSDDSEEMATVLTSMDAATILASRVAKVPTGSGSIPTAGPPVAEVPTGSGSIPTAGPIFATATMMARQLEEEMERDAQRMNEQIARDAEIARIHAKEELKIMINGLDRSNETIAKGMTFKEIKAKFTTVWKQIENFILMGLKEEAERFKRKGIRFEQENLKKLKTSEEVSEEVKSSDEVPKEKKVHTEGQRAYWKITRLGGSSSSYQFFIDLLKHLDGEDLNQLWVLVKESLSNRPPTSDIEMELWVELKRLYEPDDED